MTHIPPLSASVRITSVGGYGTSPTKPVGKRPDKPKRFRARSKATIASVDYVLTRGR